MKKLLVVGLSAIVSFGLVWHYTQSNKTVSEVPNNVENQITLTSEPHTSKETSTTKPPRKTKKNCVCCRRTTEEIRQTRKDIKWAKEMIAKHGYEEGIKRVTAKSLASAEMMQNIEKRKGTPTPTTQP